MARSGFSIVDEETEALERLDRYGESDSNISNLRCVLSRGRRQTSSDVGVPGLTDDGVGAGRLLSRNAHRLLDGFFAGGAYGSSQQRMWVSLLDRSFNRVGTHERRRECPADLTPRRQSDPPSCG